MLSHLGEIGQKMTILYSIVNSIAMYKAQLQSHTKVT